MSAIKTTESEMDTGEQLYAISEATNRDGTVDVTLHEYQRCGDYDDQVRVKFECPDNTINGEVMQWPSFDDEKYKFVRLMNRAGTGLVGVDTAFDSNTTVRADPKDWTLVAPPARRKRLTDSTTGLLSTIVPDNPIRSTIAVLWILVIGVALVLAVVGLMLL